MGDDGAMDYSVHEAWNEATNVYLVVILVSFGLVMYAKRYRLEVLRVDEKILSIDKFCRLVGLI